MSQSVHDLIGQIINPDLASKAPAPPRAPAPPSESVEVLIGRIIAPTWAVRDAPGSRPAAPQPPTDDPLPPMELPAPM